ncbi:hypothetical protein EVAR_89180_1 [Eumeta japonica]|uniref:Uncharacterized protein n=1 Tax=Eumeta variegata TaxID=151549 RepID=A0A4C1YEQ2_EUMVA|nr:hypothetical protein EVAR_89180_1 [Eumeta japonica]
MWVVLLVAAASGAWAQSEPTARTAQGALTGLRAADGNYGVFYGVPYAGPTAGHNRFKGAAVASPARPPLTARAVK